MNRLFGGQAFFSRRNVSIATLLDELKPVVLDGKLFDFQEKSRKCIFLAFSVLKNSNAGNICNNSVVEWRTTVTKLLIKTSVRDIQLNVWNLNNKKYYGEVLFLAFSAYQHGIAGYQTQQPNIAYFLQVAKRSTDTLIKEKHWVTQNLF